MAEKDYGDGKQDNPVVDSGKSLPHKTEVHFTAGQVEEGCTDQAADD
jgi:hypothetical protein